LNLCLDGGSEVEFSFNWPFPDAGRELVLGRLSPIQIDRSKSVVFSISPQANLERLDVGHEPLQKA